MVSKNISDLEKKIKIKFKKTELLQTAITHRSYINEHRRYTIDAIVYQRASQLQTRPQRTP